MPQALRLANFVFIACPNNFQLSSIDPARLWSG
jgi:hypothetical protein